MGPRDGELTPLLCLPGLTRNARDFEPVFARFGKQRRVIAMDFRGRGRSAAAADPMTYRPDVELQDTLGFLDHLDIQRVALLGTSRGGIVGMLMAALAKPRLAGLCLNDIGCKLEATGLLRIMGYVGVARFYSSWEEAAHHFAQAAHGFEHVPQQQWLDVVKRIYRETENGITQNHDLRLAETLPSRELVEDGKLPDLWSLLPHLLDIPLAILRGENSDLLSSETVSTMAEALPNLVATTVRHRGHVPFLDEAESLVALENWLHRVDGSP